MVFSDPLLLVLASASPARRATLTSAGIRHAVLVSDVDEDAALQRALSEAGELGLTPEQQVQVLANAKAQAVAQRICEDGNSCEAAVVVGCDSMFAMDGEVVGKPHSPQVARERLRRMSGRSGSLYTGHCVIDMRERATVEGTSTEGVGAPCALGVSVATVHIAPLSSDEIEAYIASGEPLEVAGSFTIDGRGGPFVENIEGDHHGVVGISLPLLRNLLGSLGLGITDFWE